MRHAMSRLCALAILLGVLAVQCPAVADDAPTKARPNILWISLEDLSPDLGCYGDSYARTPVLDEFAKNGVRFTKVFTHAPVCAPSRSGIITGMYPTSIGTHNMRCQAVLPPDSEMLYRIPARCGLLLHEQREDRLPVQPAADGMG